ncbi:OLC1v1002146C1 [Oldenlandia corymbosa var. corymbosa]|uniref:Phosphatidate cytidylyltransferase n=1 Tax=Oldenlandia corymbosa var. corymbosa TaxID=529605 RepID=A0AAV1D754_OLDCO|nr:OLC1v1002146C1 [Oldenlandia corymbosa var. corymbosa]
MAASCSTSYSSHVDIFDRFNVIPVSIAPVRGSHHHHHHYYQTQFHSTKSNSSSLRSLTLIRRRPTQFTDSKLRLPFDGPVVFGSNCGVPKFRRVIAAVARAEPERIDDFDAQFNKDEANKSHDLPVNEDSVAAHQSKASQLKKRIVFGLGIGISAGGVVLAGGWVFTVALAAVVFVGAREYFELVRSKGIADGMTPPPRYVSRVCSVFCALMPLATLYFGQIDVSVTSAAFVLVTALLLQRRSPRFSQFSSAMFGLFYCGYLPCFWVKMRCGLAVPALNTKLATSWPWLLGGPAQWTVGLVATLVSISSIIAADTCAFAGGKAFGRTPLTNISPKKTWEGALTGLGGCVATTVLLSKMLSWPISLPSAVAFGFLNFVGSLFGDLIESVIKRDAGVKDSGTLIPGHGGILDRVDSYVFTGALGYSFVKTFLRLYGV